MTIDLKHPPDLRRIKPELRSNFLRGKFYMKDRDIRKYFCDSWFFYYVWLRANTDYHTTIVIDGDVGTGKTNFATVLQNYFEHFIYHRNSFNPDNYCFTVPEFFKRLMTERDTFVTSDEAGVELSSREYFKIQTRIFSYAQMSFRSRHINMILALPAIRFLDKGVRSLCHYRITMMSRKKAVVKRIFMDDEGKIKYPAFEVIRNIPKIDDDIEKIIIAKKEVWQADKIKEWDDMLKKATTPQTQLPTPQLAPRIYSDYSKFDLDKII